MNTILVIGSLNIDMVVRVDHTPVVGETIISDNMELVCGGKGANQACAAARLGHSETGTGVEVAMLGAVGRDTYADMQRKSLLAAGVNVEHLVVKKDCSTGTAFISVNSQGDNSIVVVSGANNRLTTEDIDNNLALIQNSDAVIMQLEIPLDTVMYAARIAKSLGKIVILDPAPVPKFFPQELYQYVDVIKPNETELGRLVGHEINTESDKALDEAVAELRQKGAGDVLVTLGAQGVYVNSVSMGTYRIPAHQVKAVDTTAAGDAFTAAMTVQLMNGSNLYEAARWANYVSSIVVTRFGAQSSIPTLDELGGTN